MKSRPDTLTVGQVAARCGVSIATIHFYEARGLIRGWRTAGNQRRYPRAVLRSVAVVKVARRMGIPLRVIHAAVQSLPGGCIPTAQDWAALSAQWRMELDQRICALTVLRAELTNCIGCGCLSLDSCPLVSPPGG